MIDMETGRKLGQHRGLWFHTIGQRHGLGFGGGPWNVVKKDMEKNILYVVKGYEPIRVCSDEFRIRDMHFLTRPFRDGEERSVTIKIRHTPEHYAAVLTPEGDGQYHVKAERAIQGVAPGQFCVVYDNDFHRCFGSAEITL